jgi:hypothetical protein
MDSYMPTIISEKRMKIEDLCRWGIQVILVTGQNLYGKCQNQ